MDYDYAVDVFALNSREDSFPLVMLEASACCLPVFCFADSGGDPEFVTEDSGLVARYHDITGLRTASRHFRTIPISVAGWGAKLRGKLSPSTMLSYKGRS